MIDHYELYKSTSGHKDFYKKNPTGKKCRFCNKSYPDVSFKNIPHIIHELFGRNNIASNFECDNCNQKISKIRK